MRTPWKPNTTEPKFPSQLAEQSKRNILRRGLRMGDEFSPVYLEQGALPETDEPNEGIQVYDPATKTVYVWDGTSFVPVGGGGVSPHKTTHQDAGSDEISVAGLSGLLADPQTPLAHNVLSAFHGDTLAAAAVRGDLVVGNATPKWARLAKGTSRQILAMGANDPEWIVPPQAGSASISGVGTSFTITYTYAFSVAPIPTVVPNYATSFYISAISTTGFTLNVGTAPGATAKTIYWQAIPVS